MPIIQCPQCSAELEIDAESAGQRVQCADCEHVSEDPATDAKQAADGAAGEPECGCEHVLHQLRE